METLTSFQKPGSIEKLDDYLLQDELKNHILECFATGFISHFEYSPPVPWGHVENYSLVKDAIGSKILRERMEKEVRCGRMIGGPG